MLAICVLKDRSKEILEAISKLLWIIFMKRKSNKHKMINNIPQNAKGFVAIKV